MTQENDTKKEQSAQAPSSASEQQNRTTKTSSRPAPPPGYIGEQKSEQNVYEQDFKTQKNQEDVLEDTHSSAQKPQYSKNAIFMLDLNNKHLKRISSLVFIANIFTLVSIFLDTGVLLCGIAIICALIALREAKKLLQSKDESLVLVGQNIIKPVKTTLVFSIIIFFLDAISLAVLWSQIAANSGETESLKTLENLLFGVPVQKPSAPSNLWG